MTALPEAKLAREAEICYAVIACVTDYDSWHERREPVTVDVILNIQHQNVDTARKMIKLAVARVPKERHCICADALSTALVTAPEYIPAEQRQKLEPLIGKYLKGDN
jgi:5'-methylthioadenosine phosphorylase